MWTDTAGMKKEEKEGSPTYTHTSAPPPLARKQHPIKGLCQGQRHGPQGSRMNTETLGEVSDTTGKLLGGQLRSQFKITPY